MQIQFDIFVLSGFGSLKNKLKSLLSIKRGYEDFIWIPKAISWIVNAQTELRWS
jgi:hypothetical protein